MAQRQKSATTIAVGGGKGGVGKSLVASNLAISIARLGARVVLVDADLGSANQHTLFGIDRPGLTLQALVDGRVGSLEETVMPTRFPRVALVPGSGAVVGAANIGHARKLKLIRHIQALDADVVVVDVGAGSNNDVVDLYDMADLRFVVVAPQLTSMQNAYAFLKSALHRSMRKVALSERERGIIDGASNGCETEQVADVIHRVRQEDAVLADALRACVDTFEASIIGNMLDQPNQRRALISLSNMFRDFLGMHVPLIANLPRMAALHQSVSRRRPYLGEHASGTVAEQLGFVAEKVMVTNTHAIRSARRRAPTEEDGRLPGPLANYIRASERYRVDVACTLDVGRDVDARIVDVSQDGMRLDCDAPGFEVGQSLVVSALGQEVRATVQRVASGELGLAWQGQDSKLLERLQAADEQRVA